MLLFILYQFSILHNFTADVDYKAVTFLFNGIHSRGITLSSFVLCVA